MSTKMESREDSKIKITDIVGNLVKADQSHHKSGPVDNASDGKMEDDDVVILNVGGIRHETRIATLLKKPETRLYSVGETAKATGKKEFYFDRNPQIFPCILNYYRIGKLHMPTDVCGPAAKAELDYWELEDKDIEECCWVNYISYEETMGMLEKFQADEREKFHSVYVSPEASFIAKIKPRLWRALQDPYSSKSALIFAVMSVVIVLISITVFVIETLPYFNSVFVHASDPEKNITSEHLRKELEILTDISPNDCLLLIDNGCNIYFFIEFIIKLFAAPEKKRFFKSPLVIIEMLCLVPFYVGILIIMVHPDPIRVFFVIRLLFATRVLRIFRIFVLMKHFLALKILIYTIRASTKELFLLLVVLLIGVVIFACIIYYLEIFSDVDALELTNIPLAFWWAVITMTTVGYGDLVPKSVLGYIVGSLCAISGVLVIALSVPVIVNNFTVYYTHAQSREKLKLRKKKFEQTEKWQRLKAGLKSKLKSGALNGVLNGIKKKNTITPNDSNPGPKMSFLKLGGGKKLDLSKSKNNSDSENDKKVPSTARDVILQDVSDDVTGASSARKDEVAVIGSTSNDTKHIGNGFLRHQDDVKPQTPTTGRTQKNSVRSKFFGGKIKSPRFVNSIKSVKTKGDKDLDLQMLTPHTLGKNSDNNNRVSHA